MLLKSYFTQQLTEKNFSSENVNQFNFRSYTKYECRLREEKKKVEKKRDKEGRIPNPTFKVFRYEELQRDRIKIMRTSRRHLN
jgi:hypothetical protein